MTKPANMLLAAGLLTASLAMPLSADAHAEDNALAFVIGAAVGHAFDNDRRHLHYSHVPYRMHRHRGHVPRYHSRWRAKHHRWHHASRHRAHHRFHRHGHRHWDNRYSHYRHDRDSRRGHRDRYKRKHR